MNSFYEFTRSELTALVERPHRAVELYKSVYQGWVDDFKEIANGPLRQREDLASVISLRLPVVARRFESADGTRRYLLRLRDGELVESVLIPRADRVTFCISSQVGCALACAFCLTGQMGLIRDLSAGEIVSQVLLMQRECLTREKDQHFSIVLMGMGEPLHNYENVLKAILILHDDHGLNVPMGRITLSTAGLLPGIERLAREALFPNLSISLTGATNKARDVLMPINRKYPIEQVIEAVQRLPASRQKRVMFEYVLIKGVTDSLEEATQLAALLHGISAKVNLIPLNASPDIDFEAPEFVDVLRFQKVLRSNNVTTFIRKNRGNDVSAACGQLKRSNGEVPALPNPVILQDSGSPFSS